MATTGNLKRYLDENELDLSLQDLEIVPVKKILELRRVTVLDLSCNLLTELPEDFGILSGLVKLDLSKNRLTTLPSSFGDLSALQQLDLRDNKITRLPPCLSRLRKLRWLDLKGNPLDKDLQEVAGDCVSQAECQKCAQNIVAHMRQVAVRMEEERHRRLEQERVAERMRREALLEQKRLAKEERRLAYQRRVAEAAECAPHGDEEEKREIAAASGSTQSAPSVKPSPSDASSSFAFYIFVAIFAVILGFVIYKSMLTYNFDVSQSSAEI